MATNKNITMKQFNGTDYDTLYPKTKVEQVEGAYSQQQILADSTKTMFGLGADAVPDAAFNMLGTSLKNTRRWELYSSYTYESNSIIELYLDAPAEDVLDHEFIVEILAEKSLNSIGMYHYDYYGDIGFITDKFTSNNKQQYGGTISKFDNKEWSYENPVSTSYNGPKMWVCSIPMLYYTGRKALFHIYVDKSRFIATGLSSTGLIYRKCGNATAEILPTVKQVILSFRNNSDRSTGFAAGTKVNIYRLTEGGV